MKITHDMLVYKNACKDELVKFDEIFPQGVVITKALCLKYASVFSFDWAVCNLLSESALDAYKKALKPAQKAYYHRVAPARSAYFKITTPIRAAYKQAKGFQSDNYNTALLNAYEKAIAPAEDAYNKAIEYAWNVYYKARAIAFYKATLIKT